MKEKPIVACRKAINATILSTSPKQNFFSPEGVTKRRKQPYTEFGGQCPSSPTLDARPFILWETGDNGQRAPRRLAKTHRVHREQGTHHSPSVITSIHYMRQRKNAADSCRDVGAILTAGVDVVELPDQIKLEPPVADGLAPDLKAISVRLRQRHGSHYSPAHTYIDKASLMPGEQEFPFQPFIVRSFVESTGEDGVVGGLACRLIQQQFSVQRVQADTVPPADGYVPGGIVDPSALGLVSGLKL